MIEGEAMRDAGAPIVADQHDRPEPERLDHVGDVGRHRALVVPAHGLVGIAVAPQVGRHDRESLGERGHHLAPHVAGLRVAVEQDHARPLPEAAVVDASLVTDADDVTNHRR